jgi:hypothetical protein
MLLVRQRNLYRRDYKVRNILFINKLYRFILHLFALGYGI